MKQMNINQNPFEESKNTDEVLVNKLADAMIPGLEVDFDPDEAEKAGAFIEDALSEADALDSCIDQDDQG